LRARDAAMLAATTAILPSLMATPLLAELEADP
jgi:hypothetical protein